MNKKNTELSRAQQLQKFLQEASDLDFLALDGEAAWNALHADRPILPGLRTLWKQKQAELAALRALRAAAPYTIPLEMAAERQQLRTHLLSGTYALTDPGLIGWMQGLSRASLRQFVEQIEMLYPTMNLQGYRAIAAEAARIGWPILFREDLDHDLKTLCTPGAPPRFWWGIRSTGTDLYRPNELVDAEWALARKRHGPSEQGYYHYTGDRLRPITLDALISHLVRTLDIASYTHKRGMALRTQDQAAQIRFRDSEAAKAYYEASQSVQQAEEALRKVKRIKQQYP